MIEVKNINKSYKKVQVLNDISFNVNSGEMIAVVGKNGSGKSTMLKILSGAISADSGAISYFGKFAKGKIFSEYTGYVPQGNPLIDELNVIDNLKLWGAQNNKNLERVLDTFHLKDILKTPVRKLSGGMKRRLSIACACLNMPSVLLLDEPTASLDIYYKENIRQYLKNHVSKNGIVIMSTHDSDEIMMADRCLILKDGKLTEFKKADITMQKIREYVFL